MLKRRVLFLGVFMLLGIGVQAQYNQFGRIAQRGERGYIPPPKTVAAKEVEAPDLTLHTEDRATYYSEKFNFDAFQKEVLKKYLKKYYAQRFSIEYDPKLKFDEKLPLLAEQQYVLKTDLEGFLTPEQVNGIMGEEQFDNSSSKKRKKDKKKKKKKGKKS